MSERLKLQDICIDILLQGAPFTNIDELSQTHTKYDAITYPFPHFNGWELIKRIHPTLYDGCDYLSMLGSKLIHVSKRGPRSLTADIDSYAANYGP